MKELDYERRHEERKHEMLMLQICAIIEIIAVLKVK